MKTTEKLFNEYEKILSSYRECDKRRYDVINNNDVDGSIRYTEYQSIDLEFEDELYKWIFKNFNPKP